MPVAPSAVVIGRFATPLAAPAAPLRASQLSALGPPTLIALTSAGIRSAGNASSILCDSVTSFIFIVLLPKCITFISTYLFFFVFFKLFNVILYIHYFFFPLFMLAHQ